jgi:hypothetical protein
MDSNEIKKIGKLQELVTKLQEWLSILKNKQTTMPFISPLYEEAVKYLGTDASPNDIASDNFGCAESVSNIIAGIVRGFPILTGTWSLYDIVRLSPRFLPVSPGEVPQPGDLIICVTGQGKGSIPNGHVGIVSTEGVIMSNDSRTGKFEANYTFKSWNDRYVVKGRYPVHIFRLL